MAKTRQQKETAKNVLVENLRTAKSVVFASYQGLKVKETDELRSQCRQGQITYIASKKTILEKALKEVGADVDAGSFDGSVALVFGDTDEVAPAQLVANFAKTHTLMTIFGGLLEGKVIEAAKVKELAALPNKHQLLGQLVGTLNAPISGFVNVLAGNMRGLVTVLSAIKDQKPA